ncbi:hypothetical protein V1515DRAFT_417022 [Lipomyces mesembrius]
MSTLTRTKAMCLAYQAQPVLISFNVFLQGIQNECLLWRGHIHITGKTLYSSDRHSTCPESPVPAVVTAPSAKRENKGQIRPQANEVPSLVLQESMTLPMAPIDDEQASYQRALNFLTANEPERRLDICLS